MIVFKSYFKIVKKHWLPIFINLIVFVAIAMIFTLSSGDMKVSNDYSKMSVGYTIEKDSFKNKALVEYLEDTFKAKEFSSDKKEIQDALFFHDIDYMLLLEEEGFKSYQVPNSATGFLVENNINKYLNIYDSYEKAGLDSVGKLTAETMAKKVSINSPEGMSNKILENLNNYMNMYVYCLFGTLVMGVGICTLSLRKNKVYERTVASPMTVRQHSYSLFASNIVFGISILIFLSVLASIWFSDVAGSNQFRFFVLNSIVFLIPGTAFAFMISQLVSGVTPLSAISTLSGLAQSFICGAFVPQEYMSEWVLKLGSIFPGYWFILNNNNIAKSAQISFGDIAMPMLVQLLFAGVFVAIGLFSSRLSMRKKQL